MNSASEEDSLLGVRGRTPSKGEAIVMTRVAKHVTGQGMRLACAWQEACAFGVLLEGGNPPSPSGFFND